MKFSWFSSSNTRTEVPKYSRSRNAFMQFLNTYRQLRPRESCPTPAWVTACEAGRVWSRMPLNAKFHYIEAARNAGYSFRSRDRRLNTVMSHLRRALENEDRTDLRQLSSAVKQMRLWKRRVLESLCGPEDEEDSCVED